MIFYTYNGVSGNSPDRVNIAILFVAAATSYIFETGCQRFLNNLLLTKPTSTRGDMPCVLVFLFLFSVLQGRETILLFEGSDKVVIFRESALGGNGGNSKTSLA